MPGYYFNVTWPERQQKSEKAEAADLEERLLTVIEVFLLAELEETSLIGRERIQQMVYFSFWNYSLISGALSILISLCRRFQLFWLFQWSAVV